jgi:hypothetical protein
VVSDITTTARWFSLKSKTLLLGEINSFGMTEIIGLNTLPTKKKNN